MIDGCTCGNFIRDSADAALNKSVWEKFVASGLRATRAIRFLPNPAYPPGAWRAIRDLPVTNFAPAGERIAVVTACAEGESAPDIDAGGFSDIATWLIAAQPKFAWDGSLLAENVGFRLSSSIGNHPVASGPIQNLAWPSV